MPQASGQKEAPSINQQRSISWVSSVFSTLNGYSIFPLIDYDVFCQLASVIDFFISFIFSDMEIMTFQLKTLLKFSTSIK